jgi:hypothetical protein
MEKPLPGVAQHRNARFVRRRLHRSAPVARQDVGERQNEDGVRDHESDQDEERNVGLEHSERCG